MSHLARFLKRFPRWFFRDCRFARLVRNRILGTTIPPLTGLYFLTLDVWGDKWSKIQDYSDLHQLLFTLLVATAIATLFFRALGDWIGPRRIDESYPELLEELLISIGRIMELKTRRFESRMSGLRPNSNVFDAITHPKDQMKVILSEARSFFVKQLPNVSENRFDITILYATRDGDSEYLAAAQVDWSHTDPDQLIQSSTSTARYCLDTGETVFFADKVSASEAGQYQMSKRDKQHGRNGSICCIPISVAETSEKSGKSGRKHRCVVTFTTYGTPICDVEDSAAQEAVQFLCKMFADRIRLEFILFVIKQSRLESKTGKKQKGR